MASADSRGALFRALEPDQQSRVTNAELLFDLVFVFAVTQVSHFLLSRFTATGAVETALLFLAVWWVWVFTAWITNWLDPDQTAVRILLFLLMLAGLVLSTSIPHAFDARGLWFAAAYAAMQVGHTAFFVAAAPPSRPAVRRNGIRILAWLAASAVFWILGGLAEGERRLWLWAVALAIEYASPLVRFWIPLYGASTIQDWYVKGSHMAERCAGFILIALGESIVVTGATFADLSWTAPTGLAFVSAFAASIAMWWIYFHKGAEAGSEKISRSAESGRLARSAYTYLHMPIVGGIILSAVADDLVLAHPDGHVDLNMAACALGGPLLFLVGTILFKHNIRGFLQLSHGVGIVALGGVALYATDLSPLVLSLLTTFVLIVVAIWESVSLRSNSVQ